MKNKNIILISIDCLRTDCIEDFPNKELLEKYNLDLSKLKTPTLNKLLKQGTLFTNCFTASTYTTASHASILTGYYPVNHSVQEYFRNTIAKKTVFELAKQYGKNYFTLFCTDFPFILGKHIGFDRGVDEYLVCEEIKGIKMLKKEMRKKRNFLSFFHFGDIHTPYGLSSLENDGEKFINKVRELNVKFKTELNGSSKELEWLEKDRRTEEVKLRNLYHKIIDRIYQNGDYSLLMQLYIEGVAYFDSLRFRKFIQELDNNDMLKNTEIFIFSDHGERWWGDSHGHHDNLYDDTIRVPLIAIGSRFPSGKEVVSQIRTIDIVPTILYIINPAKQIKFDGNNLLPLDKIKETYAIGEIWTCKDVNDIKKLMYKIKEKGKIVNLDKGKNKGYLWKEFIRNSKYKIINTYNDGKVSAKTFKLTNNAEKEGKIDEVDLVKMQECLSLYRGRKEKIKKNVICDYGKINHLKNNLRLLGYRI